MTLCQAYIHVHVGNYKPTRRIHVHCIHVHVQNVYMYICLILYKIHLEKYM